MGSERIARVSFILFYPEIFTRLDLEDSEEYQSEQMYIMKLLTDYRQIRTQFGNARKNNKLDELRQEYDDVKWNLYENIHECTFLPLIKRKANEIMNYVINALNANVRNIRTDEFDVYSPANDIEDQVTILLQKKYGTFPIYVEMIL